MLCLFNRPMVIEKSSPNGGFVGLFMFLFSLSPLYLGFLIRYESPKSVGLFLRTSHNLLQS